MIDLKFPCSQRPSEMKKSGCGFYCQSCDKVIHDFRGKTLRQINEIKDQTQGEVCGVFDREMVRSKMDRRLSLFRAAFVLVFLFGVSSTELFAQSESEVQEPPIEQKQERVVVRGTVMDEYGEPLPFVKVGITLGESYVAGVVTDFDGLYQLEVPEHLIGTKIDMKAQFVGYQDCEIRDIATELNVVNVDFKLSTAQALVGVLIITTCKRQIPSDPVDFNKTVLTGDDLRNY